MDLQRGLVYGPVASRRFGRSLGINLTPPGRKTCNYNCAYCQYGWTEFPSRGEYPSPSDVIDALDQALERDPDVDAITVAGNGEPTLHPAFAPIADGIYHVRQRRAPQARLALLSNGSTLSRLDVVSSLSRFDARCMKLDAGDATTFRLMNAPMIPLARLIADLRGIGRLMLQSMFVRDAEQTIDNTTPRAVDAWLDAVDRIRPQSVDIYTLARRPARGSLVAAPADFLDRIAARVVALGIPARVHPRGSYEGPSSQVRFVTAKAGRRRLKRTAAAVHMLSWPSSDPIRSSQQARRGGGEGGLAPTPIRVAPVGEHHILYARDAQARRL